MFRLPVCPYCHTVYTYSEIRNMKGKKCQCYHCKKEFILNKKLCVLPVAAVCILLIIINLFLLHTTAESEDMKILPVMAVINMTVILLSLLSFPFTTRFSAVSSHKKDAGSKSRSNPKIKNSPVKSKNK